MDLAFSSIPHDRVICLYPMEPPSKLRKRSQPEHTVFTSADLLNCQPPKVCQALLDAELQSGRAVHYAEHCVLSKLATGDGHYPRIQLPKHTWKYFPPHISTQLVPSEKHDGESKTPRSAEGWALSSGVESFGQPGSKFRLWHGTSVMSASEAE